MSFAPTYLHCRYVLPSPPCTTPLSIAATPTLPLPPLPRLIIMQLNGEGVQTKAFWHPATTACFASRCENHFITQQHERHKTDATTAVVKIVTLGICCNMLQQVLHQVYILHLIGRKFRAEFTGLRIGYHGRFAMPQGVWSKSGLVWSGPRRIGHLKHPFETPV